MQFGKFIFGLMIGISGCSHSRWDGKVESWGEMREVLHDGHTQARVTPGELLNRGHAFGVGAVEGLRGEIVVDDNRCWAARVVAEHGKQTLRVSVSPPGLQATLLAVAFVPSWTDYQISEIVKVPDLEDYIQKVAQGSGIDTVRPFPFIIESQFLDLDAHVINGDCPMNETDGSNQDKNRPYRLDGWSGHGKIVGFHAENSAGKLTHYGTKLHMHLLSEAPNSVVAHVEEVSIVSGVVLRLPSL